jgi:hypothetical protein
VAVRVDKLIILEECMSHFLGLAFLLTLVAVPALAGTPPDYLDPCSALLNEYVHEGVVDYAGFKAGQGRLEALLERMAAVDPDALARPERLAFYINAYNLWTIRLILDHWPGIRSIKEAGSLLRSPWKRPFVRLAGKTVSLDDIEHGILRRHYPDPRLHFVLNCASKSCPPLLSEPYRGQTLEAMLEARTRACLNDPAAVRVSDGRLYVSRLFDWYAEDFGGKQGVVDFIRRYADPALAAALDGLSDRQPVFMEYDWSLNDTPGPWSAALGRVGGAALPAARP